MSDQVPLNQGTIPHLNPLASAFSLYQHVVVSKRWVLLIALASFVLVHKWSCSNFFPVLEVGWVDGCAGEELTEVAQEFSHEDIVQSLSTFGVGIIQRIVHGLTDYVIELFEKPLFRIFGKPSVLDERETDEIGSYSIKKEFNMVYEGILWVAYFADDVPEAVGNEGVSVLKIQ